MVDSSQEYVLRAEPNPSIKPRHIQPVREDNLINALKAVSTAQLQAAESILTSRNGLPNTHVLKRKNSSQRLSQFAKQLELNKTIIDSFELLSQPEKYSLSIDDAEALDHHLHDYEMKQLGERDGLTGLITKHALPTVLASDLHEQRFNHRQTPSESPAWMTHDSGSVMIFDADKFKSVNDIYGHGMGDKVLSILGEALRQSFRDTDILVRYGGEELVVISPGLSSEQATARYFKFITIYQKLLSDPKNQIPKELLNSTVSAGLSSYNRSQLEQLATASTEEEKQEQYKQLFQAPDTLLYEAKQKGRNRLALNRNGTTVLISPKSPPSSPTPA